MDRVRGHDHRPKNDRKNHCDSRDRDFEQPEETESMLRDSLIDGRRDDKTANIGLPAALTI